MFFIQVIPRLHIMILREVYKQYYTKYSFWIQKSISCDDVLCGTPDYIFSEKSILGKTMLEKPIVIIFEAKRNDFEQGWLRPPFCAPEAGR